MSATDLAAGARAIRGQSLHRAAVTEQWRLGPGDERLALATGSRSGA